MSHFNTKVMKRSIAIRFSLGVILSLGVCAGSSASTNQLVHVRGEELNGHAHETDIILPWDSNGPKELWRRRIGEESSGTIIVADRIDTQTQSLRGQFVVCINLRDGSTIWETRYNCPWDTEGQWPGPYASPTYRDGFIDYAGCFGSVGCLNANTRMPGFGYACTPLAYDSKESSSPGGR